MSNNESTKQIPIHFRVPDSIPRFTANGAFGGVSPHGQISLFFYVDTWTPPAEAVLEIAPDKSGREVTPDLRREIIRTAVAALTLEPEEALGFARWLENKAKIALGAAGHATAE